jgi:proline dehydrogenase
MGDIMINKLIARLLPYFPKRLIWVISRRYIAGEHIDDAIVVSRELNKSGMMVTIDLLGENITNLTEAESYKIQYISLIKKYADENINGNFSVKPSMFGLLLNFDDCYQNLRDIIKTADHCNSFVRIDMEDSSCTSNELTLFRILKNEFPFRVGLVLQAYLHRTSQDIKDLMDLHQNSYPLNIRLCKGIYSESESISFKNFQEIRENFIEDLRFMLQNGMYVGIATHDKYLIDNAYELIDQFKVPNDKYEFQMLYGVTPKLRQSIVAKGHRMRVYVPYGDDWFNYSIRRLNENPNMVSHIIKALFIRD